MTIEDIEKDLAMMEFPSLFTEVLVHYSYRMDNHFFYHFRPMVLELNAEQIAKNQQTQGERAVSKKAHQHPIVNGVMHNPVTHIVDGMIDAVSDTLDNIKKSEMPIESIYEDVHLYSDVKRNDLVTNATKSIRIFKNYSFRSNNKQKGSRIKLISSKDIDAEENKNELNYLVYWYQDHLYHIAIDEANMTAIMQKYRELVAKKRQDLNVIKQEALDLVVFNLLVKQHLDRQAIQHGWTDQYQIKKMEPKGWIISILIGKNSGKSTSAIAILGFLVVITPLISVLVNILASQAAIYYVYNEHEKAKYRKAHLGRNPEGADKVAIERAAFYFSLQLAPCSLYVGFSMMKDMNLADTLLKAVDHFVTRCSRSILRHLSLELHIGMAILSGLTMAFSVTLIAALAQSERYKERGSLAMVFLMSFLAGMICYSASMIPGSNRLITARAAEELVYGAVTLSLGLSLYHAPGMPQAATRAMVRFKPHENPSVAPKLDSAIPVLKG